MLRGCRNEGRPQPWRAASVCGFLAVALAVSAPGQEAPGWSGFEGRRALAPAEVEVVRAQLVAWAGTLGEPELVEAAARVQVLRAEELPLYRVAVVTLAESRALERVTVPFTGGEEPQRSVGEVDVWGPPRPEHAGYAAGGWRLPVTGSARVVGCPACSGKGDAMCAECSGDGKKTCSRCRGQGTLPCSTCGGDGRTSCSTCGGDGRRGMGKNRRRCSTCSGTGKRNCSVCSASGRRQCTACRGQRKVACVPCSGQGKRTCAGCKGAGRLLESLEIRIELAPQALERVITQMDEAWIGRVTFPPGEEEWVDGEGLAARATTIPDPWLRGAILAQAERGRAGVERVFRQGVSVRRLPARLFAYEWGEETYECLAVGEGLIMPDSPARRWAGRKAEDARRLLAGGGSLAEAEAAATRVLRVDAECAAAREVAEEVGRRRAEETRRAEEERERESAKRAEEESRARLRVTLYAVGGCGSTVVLAVVGLLVWATRRPGATPDQAGKDRPN